MHQILNSLNQGRTSPSSKLQIKCSHLNHQTRTSSKQNTEMLMRQQQLFQPLGQDHAYPARWWAAHCTKTNNKQTFHNHKELTSKTKALDSWITPWGQHQWCPSSATAAGCCVKWHHCSCRSVVGGSRSSGGHHRSSGIHPPQCLAWGRSSLQLRLQGQN